MILVVFGPNLDLSGERDPRLYGGETFADHLAVVRAAAERVGETAEVVQSASEAELVSAVHGARGRALGVVINAGALTHYGWSLRDALELFAGPVVEVHLSHPNAREPWRHTSVVSSVADASITGLGSFGYEKAIEAVMYLRDRQNN